MVISILLTTHPYPSFDILTDALFHIIVQSALAVHSLQSSNPSCSSSGWLPIIYIYIYIYIRVKFHIAVCTHTHILRQSTQACPYRDLEQQPTHPSHWPHVVRVFLFDGQPPTILAAPVVVLRVRTIVVVVFVVVGIHTMIAPPRSLEVVFGWNENTSKGSFLGNIGYRKVCVKEKEKERNTIDFVGIA